MDKNTKDRFATILPEGITICSEEEKKRNAPYFSLSPKDFEDKEEIVPKVKNIWINIEKEQVKMFDSKMNLKTYSFKDLGIIKKPYVFDEVESFLKEKYKGVKIHWE